MCNMSLKISRLSPKCILHKQNMHENFKRSNKRNLSDTLKKFYIIEVFILNLILADLPTLC